VIVADGLMAFLTREDLISLLDRLIGHFPGGEVAFNGYSRFAIWAAKHYHGTQSVAGLIRSPAFDDPHEPERWNPSLQLVREILLTRDLRSPSSRRPCAGSPAWPPTAPRCPGEAPPPCTTASSRGVDHAMARVEVGGDA
jgi:O-methyltransferase involved in polyketide biosynthesis